MNSFDHLAMRKFPVLKFIGICFTFQRFLRAGMDNRTRDVACSYPLLQSKKLKFHTNSDPADSLKNIKISSYLSDGNQAKPLRIQ